MEPRFINLTPEQQARQCIDEMLVPYNVFTTETEITKNGSRITLGERVDRRERLTRKKFWSALDEDLKYSGRQLNEDTVKYNEIIIK